MSRVTTLVLLLSCCILLSANYTRVLKATPANNGNDSLAVYVFGDFKNETFKFFSQDKVITHKFTRGHSVIVFYIKIDSTIKNGDKINLSIHRKGGLFSKFKSTYFFPHFVEGKKYFIVYRDFKLKNKYSFSEHWINEPKKKFIISRNVFYTDSHLKYKPQKIKYK
jgi:hypothetical protein